MIEVFVADDHEVLRMGLHRAFESTPDIRIVGELDSTADIVQQIVSAHPNMVLWNIAVDSIQPEHAKRIKELLPDARILVFSQMDEHTHICAALAAGADGYVWNYSSIDQLKSAVRSVASGVGWLDPHVATRVLQVSAMAYLWKARHRKSDPRQCMLSDREREVLSLLAEGLSNQHIADRLCLSTETVKTHIRHIMDKLNVQTRTEAAIKAVREGLCA